MDDSFPSLGPLRRSLAEAAPFTLGALRVEPALLSVERAGEVVRLEPRVMKVLVALQDARGAVVSREALIASCWGGRVVTDDSVQRCIAALRRLAASVEPAPFTIETISKVGYRLLTQPSPAAPTVEVETVPAPEPARRPDRRLLVAAGAAVAVGMAILAWFLFLAPPPRVVAVKPFEVASGDAALARTLPEAVAADLAAVGVPAEYAPERRRAAYVVEGVVSAVGGKTQAVVRIEHGRTGDTVWTGTFAASGEELDRLRPQVSGAVGSAFTGPVPLFDQAEARHLAAKLRIAAHLAEQRGMEALTEAERLLRSAKDDPVALALFAESAAQALIAVPASQREDLWRRGRVAAELAVRLDPANGQAWSARATLTPPADYAARLRVSRAGVRRAPDSALAHDGLARALGAVGQARESARWRLRAAAADPLSRHHFQGVILAQADLDGQAGAYERLAEARRRWPGDAYWDWQELFLATRFLDAASLTRARAGLAGHLAHAPRLKRRLDLLERAIAERSPAASAALAAHCLDPSMPWRDMTTLCPYALAALGRHDEAFRALELFLSDAYLPPPGSPGASAPPWGASKAAVLYRPPFAEMRRDPRMWRLFDRLALVEFWTASGEWPDFCRDRSVSVDCPAMARRAIAERR